jgi:small-conductance mechanosensitive channel
MSGQASPIVAEFSRLLDRILGILPELAAAIAVLIIGWLVARLLRALTIRFASVANRMIVMLGVRVRAPVGPMRDSTLRVISEIVFWLVILIFLTVATNILGLGMFAGWLDRLISYLPKILSGLLIIFAGIVLSNIARDAVIAALGGISVTQRMFLARAAQIVTLTVLAIVGIDQIGVDISVVVTMLAITLAGILGGLSIAFGLGARGYVSNLIGAHYLGRDYQEGERIRINNIEGTILEITSVAVILETNEGRLTVPARLFSEEAVLLYAGERSHG